MVVTGDADGRAELVNGTAAVGCLAPPDADCPRETPDVDVGAGVRVGVGV